MKNFLQACSTYIPLLVLAGMLSAGLFFSVADLPKGDWCLFKRTMGFDCPGCGLTRSFLLIPHGEWHEVLRLNAAAPLLYVFFVGAFLHQVRSVFRIESKIFSLFSNQKIFILSQIIAVVLLLQWGEKVHAYFSVHSWQEVTEKWHGNALIKSWTELLRD